MVNTTCEVFSAKEWRQALQLEAMAGVLPVTLASYVVHQMGCFI
jgi:hypothetical protein